jgi:hypothetical protein
MKLNKKQIPIIAAFIQTIQFGFAGYIYAGWLGVFVLGIMGALVSLVVSYGSSQLADIAEKRKGQSTAAMIAVLFFSPILVGTATWLHLTIISNPIWRGVVSFAWGTLADLSPLLAGFVAGKGLFDAGKQPKKKGKGAGNGKKVAGNKKKVAGKQKAVAAEPLTNETFAAYVAAHPNDSHTAIAKHFQVSRQAIDKRFEKEKPLAVGLFEKAGQK